MGMVENVISRAATREEEIEQEAKAEELMLHNAAKAAQETRALKLGDLFTKVLLLELARKGYPNGDSSAKFIRKASKYRLRFERERHTFWTLGRTRNAYILRSDGKIFKPYWRRHLFADGSTFGYIEVNFTESVFKDLKEFAVNWIGMDPSLLSEFEFFPKPISVLPRQDKAV